MGDDPPLGHEGGVSADPIVPTQTAPKHPRLAVLNASTTEPHEGSLPVRTGIGVASHRARREMGTGSPSEGLVPGTSVIAA
jgi:hypothetical protein